MIRVFRTIFCYTLGDIFFVFMVLTKTTIFINEINLTTKYHDQYITRGREVSEKENTRDRTNSSFKYNARATDPESRKKRTRRRGNFKVAGRERISHNHF